jgi:D-beta-D-heptose 7-phosphate kinase/D-beta-D-heptose 1-phosphate adenosyltransferase
MKTIWSNGCYDILHTGHLHLLRYAKSLGDKLIVGIDSDERVKSLKGSTRPINNQEDRKFFLESLRFVDEVVVFNTSLELEYLIKKFHIAKIVIGDDYTNKPVIGSKYAEVIFFPKILDKSSSNIIRMTDKK